MYRGVMGGGGGIGPGDINGVGGGGGGGSDEWRRGFSIRTTMRPKIISTRRKMQARRPVFF